MRILASILIAALATTAHAAPIDMSPYPFEVTTGVLCESAQDLTTYLDHMVSGQENDPALQCLDLPSGFDIQAVATPQTVYHNGNVYGMITRYDSPNMPTGYGIMALELPSNGTPAPSAEDQHI